MNAGILLIGIYVIAVVCVFIMKKYSPIIKDTQYGLYLCA